MNYLLSDIYPGIKPEVYSFFYFHYPSEDIIEILPNCHAAYYPLSFNKSSKAILSGELNFFNQKFYRTFNQVKLLEPQQWNIIHNNIQKKQALVLNFLDDCFGHCIIKILNLCQAHDNYVSEFDLICIVPTALSYLIPKNKVNVIIEINLGFYDLSHARDLKPVFNQLYQYYHALDHFLFPMYNTHKKTQVQNFFQFYPDQTSNVVIQPNRVTFYYRSGFFRSWAGFYQAKRVSLLFEIMRGYFSDETVFTVVGDKDKNAFPSWIEDFRTTSFNQKLDQRYNQIFKESHIVIGYFGSGLYLPSILTDVVVHLVSRDKLRLLMEDALNYESTSILSSYQNIHLMGGMLCRDLSAKKVAHDIITLYKSYIEKKFKMDFFQSYNQMKVGQKEYILNQHSHFNYIQALELEEKIIERVNKKMFIWNKVYRLLSGFRKK